MSNITMSKPSGAALLRKLTQPLYDTRVLANAVAVPATVQYFRIPIGGVLAGAATNKTEADTNLTSQGSLGVPQIFDLDGFNYEVFLADGSVAFTSNIVDMAFIYTTGVFRFFFGQSRPWLEVPLTQIPTGTALTGRLDIEETIGPTAGAFLHNGPASVEEKYDFTVGRQSIRLHSAEPFNCEVSYPQGSPGNIVGAAIRTRAYLTGSLYAAL